MENSPEETKRPYKLYEDPLLLHAAEGDRLLRSNLAALEVADDFVARSPQTETYVTLRDTMETKIREDIARLGYVTSEPEEPQQA